MNNNASKFVTTQALFVMVSDETSDSTMLLPHGTVISGPVRTDANRTDLVFFLLEDGRTIGAIEPWLSRVCRRLDQEVAQ
jgi:hypothetical protein